MEEKERLNVSESTDVNAEMRPLDVEDKKSNVIMNILSLDCILNYVY